MKCEKCNNEIKIGDNFCGRCGTKVVMQNNQNEFNNINTFQTNSSPNINMYKQPIMPNIELGGGQNNQNLNYYNTQNRQKKNWKSIVSLVIGIITIFAVFIFQFLVIPLSIVGIVFGVIALIENKKNKVGLILNIISLLIAIPITIYYSYIDDYDYDYNYDYNYHYNDTQKNIIGTWNCKSFDGNGESEDYIVTMILNNENKFQWGKYNDVKDNHVIGTYEFKELYKTNDSNNTNGYSLTLTGDEYVSDGILQNEPYQSTYKVIIAKNTEEALLMNTITYNMYYCYRSDKTSSKIEKNSSYDYDMSKEKYVNINRLKYTISSSLNEDNANTNTYKIYNYNSTNAKCDFKVIVSDLCNELTVQQYFERYIYNDKKDLSKIYSKMINGTEWSLLEVDDNDSYTRYGVYIDDKNAYGISFSTIKDYNNECLNLYNDIIESIIIN